MGPAQGMVQAQLHVVELGINIFYLNIFQPQFLLELIRAMIPL